MIIIDTWWLSKRLQLYYDSWRWFLNVIIVDNYYPDDIVIVYNYNGKLGIIIIVCLYEWLYIK